MRCRFCGSRSLHEDKQHKNFSGGKAVAGAVTFGVIGAAAGFIGKDKDGYRCGACGAFMEAPMMYVMEDMVNSAIEKAKAGESRSMYDYYKAQYPNIEDVPQAAVTAPTAAALPSAAADRAFAAAERIEHTAEDGPSPIKRKYFYGYWQPDCPIYIDTIYIRSGPQGDLLALDARNQDSRTIRSAYYQVTAYDDTGDEVSSVRCVYQNINTGCGWALGNDIEFALNTNLAYRVDIACEKIAFENGDVWRAPKTLEALPVTEQTLLTNENFPRLDYARRKLWSKYARHAQTYMPVDHGEYWQCACRMPVKKGGVCHLETHGDKTYGELMEILSQENLRKDQQEAVRKRAADRAEKTIALYQAGAEKPMQANYGKALAQMQMDTVAGMTNAIALFEKYPDYKDTPTRIEACKAKIPILQEQEKQEQLAAEKKAEERRAEEARIQAEKEAQEKARKAKNKKIGIASAISLVVAVAGVLTITKIIVPNNKYNKAIALQEAGQHEEAIVLFDSLGDFKDSKSRSIDSKEVVQAAEHAKLEAINEAKHEEAYLEAIDKLGKAGNDSDSLLEIIKAFEDLADYKDSSDYVKEAKYRYAITLLSGGPSPDYDKNYKAKELFVELGDYKDSDLYSGQLYYVCIKSMNSNSYETFYNYNEYGRLTDVETEYENGKLVWYLVGTTSDPELEVTYSYNKDGTIASMQSVRHRYNGEVISSLYEYQYEYNSDGLLEKKTIIKDGKPNEIITYQYSSYEGNKPLIKAHSSYRDLNLFCNEYGYLIQAQNSKNKNQFMNYYYGYIWAPKHPQNEQLYQEVIFATTY